MEEGGTEWKVKGLFLRTCEAQLALKLSAEMSFKNNTNRAAKRQGGIPMHIYAVLINRLTATVPGGNSLVYILLCCNHKVLKDQGGKKKQTC